MSPIGKNMSSAPRRWEESRPPDADAADVAHLWRSLEQLAGAAELRDRIEREFPDGAWELADPLSRRRFLGLMGASLALAGLASCSRQPIEKLVPYVKQPEGLIPGRPLYFASADILSGFARGVLVESHEGRPTKIEGNPEHPASLGATDVFMQATVLQLYDPDRSQTVLRGGLPATWDDFLGALVSETPRWTQESGANLVFITGNITSPTLRDQFLELFGRYPAAKWVVHEPALNPDAFRPIYTIETADVICSLDADFLSFGSDMLTNARAFAKRRNPGSMNRLYVIESMPSLTGAAADHRFALSPAAIPPLIEQIRSILSGAIPSDAPRWLAPMVRDLQAHAGRCLLIAGEYLSAPAQAAIRQLNEDLGNVGKTVTYPTGDLIAEGNASLENVTAAMRDGTVQAAFCLGCNPVHTAPADLAFAEALDKVPLAVHHGLFVDETAARCQWHVPSLHSLEDWSDAVAYDGTAGIIQPLILPLYDGVSPHELIAGLAGGFRSSSYEIVRDYWRRQSAGDNFEAFWRRAVHDGVIPGTGAHPPKRERLESRRPLRVSTGENPAIQAPGLELLIRPDPHVYDGRFANNAWLQELPKPLTKLVWENAAHIALATAERLGLRHGEVVELTYSGRSLQAPLWILPGMAENCVQISLGYGRSQAGRVGNSLGFNAYAIQTSAAPWGAPGLEVRGTGETHQFATTQDHGAMQGRHLVQFGNLREFEQDPDFARAGGHETAPGDSLYPPYRYDGYAWGMAIDLNTCIGCSACVIACQAENNIPVVGRDQVRRGREMHWIRVDRYFSGEKEQPKILHQPVPCMHCENAPCELVCPVAATVHDSEGLNAMVYNRCIGTRYCSNNCPYKVRRFNFLQYADTTTPTLKMQRNPNVTVRSRGVIEKCTYCVQRINAARIVAQNENRPIRDGEIIPACAQACPADAISFGNINDPASRVAKEKTDPRNYSLLAELNTRPRTTYLARIFNPNPEIENEA
jgi:MoCo/4Fe-4S cofactor protein with predicted Tat translocation signal